MSEPDREDILRVWALENAVNSTNRNAKPSTIIKRAEKYYGFLVRGETEIFHLKGKEIKK